LGTSYQIKHGCLCKKEENKNMNVYVIERQLLLICYVEIFF